ncbi:hypothetical protein PHYSODRAFT_297756 [Phytophthora sojae]|uniref:Uncharacterized protein n=1 Tax=Phytophthora sojae (strain P6497) TaxID=1094619 RepID=G4Z8Q5_PHYSP|nr:hypothetical protein PHYSODRAFT_297756 [Phytophthora sojae]EGZ19087.1 hypothetical protein PHYSODRAFT_297756 [Phytophthora sojae]|eukprot:XP_009521804.1 hypothetical protein PHYSODRAFT_297756 [Phytophthora sojae]
MSEKLKVPAAAPQYVDLSRLSFAIWWSVLLAVHLVICGYNASFALFYRELQNTYLYACLDYSGIGMPAEDHQVISLVNAAMAAVHGACVLLMVAGSVWRRELVFSPWRKDKNRAYRVSKLDSRSNSNKPALPRSRLVRLYSYVLGQRGLVGVNGSNFHSILVARELVEMALQTVQAYRMSWLLPRMLLNRFYLALIVLNCWSSVLVYTLLFKRSEARKRFAYLMCDCTLNVVSCIGVPLIVVLSYIGEYDWELTGFPLVKWYDDEWSARVLNEFQMVLVVSWMDLASRTIFSIGVISTTNSLKDLLRKSSGASLRRIACDAEVVKTPDKEGRVDSKARSGTGSRLQSIKPNNLQSRARRGLSHFVYAVFALWGLVIIALHLQASVQPEQPQCVLQVHPWAVSNPACYLAVLDCHRLGISGKKEEVEAKWNEFDRSTVVTLVIRHCPALEVPDSIGDFHITTGVKVYNSTINDWGVSAALTNTNHPELIWFYLVRVNLTDGILPAGALSTDFPGKLYDLEFTYTNIRELPDDLDSSWLIGTTVYFEYSELTSIPPSLMRLDPYSISFVGSPIAQLPPEIFEVADMVYMYMAGIPIQELPRNVANISPQLGYIYMVNTNISFFWSWADPLVERLAEIIIAGSPYCTELEKIKSGEASGFSSPSSPEYSRILMDPSEANLDIISQVIFCDEQPLLTVYPIDFEDSYITQEQSDTVEKKWNTDTIAMSKDRGVTRQLVVLMESDGLFVPGYTGETGGGY